MVNHNVESGVICGVFSSHLALRLIMFYCKADKCSITEKCNNIVSLIEESSVKSHYLKITDYAS